MLILAFYPFVSTEHRYFLCNSWWSEIHVVISERLNNRASLCCIFCKLFQFQFFCVELAGLVVKFGLIFGKEFLYIGFLCFIFIESYLTGSQFLFRLFKLLVITENL